jgi:5-methylcytosine-specific restriction endonuclease McrA
LVKRDRILEAEFVSHLGEVEARRLHLEQGCSSMFDYCVKVLGLSEGVAYKRIGVARAARKFPEVGLALSGRHSLQSRLPRPGPPPHRSRQRRWNHARPARPERSGRRGTLSASQQTRRSTHNSRSSVLSFAIRREVWLRDDGRCTYQSLNGRRCGSHGAIEFHHRIPWARHQEYTIDNIALRCRAHNQYEAELDFGTAHMARFRREVEVR